MTRFVVKKPILLLNENRNRNVPIIKLEFALVAINGKRYLHEKCIYVQKDRSTGSGNILYLRLNVYIKT